jgi:hypothetical protein
VEAGKENLRRWHEKTGNHRTQALVHGAYRSTIRRRYSDKRTPEGARLAQIIDAIEEALPDTKRVKLNEPQ